MQISIQSKGRIFAECYAFVSFANYKAKNILKNRYSQKRLGHAKHSGTDANYI